ncbi:MAG: DUF86 domain-containing protein [Methylococcales bacterium]|nr:DUF86 domain-containing protein [Methylococcales bacterium]
MRDLTALKAYLNELNQQVDGYIFDLDELAAVGNLTHRDYYAIERLLQVLIEACIGICKHWLKFSGHSVPNEAYQAFELLARLNLLPESELITWRKMIGLRNALVHDYLNLDRAIVLSIVQEKHYLQLVQFIRHASNTIQQQIH